MNQREIRRLLDPIRARLRLIVSRAIVAAVRDDEGFQILQLKVLAGEVIDGVERFENYGFTSSPPEGSESLVAFVGGSRSHGVAFAVGHRGSRKKDKARGESAQYSDEGDYILLKRGRIIEVFSGGEIKVTAPVVTIDGAELVDIKSADTVTVDGASKAEIKSAGAVDIDGGTVSISGTTTIESKPFLPHKHSGVSSGSSDTGGVV